MPYVITSLCTNDGACVEVCPVACIHTKPGAPQFYVDPEVCIDCEQCEIVCPVDAIFKDVDMPAEHLESIEINAAFFRQNKAAIGPVPFESAWAMIQSAHEYAQMVGAAVTAVVVDEGQGGSAQRRARLQQSLHRCRISCRHDGIGPASAPAAAAQPVDFAPR